MGPRAASAIAPRNLISLPGAHIGNILEEGDMGWKCSCGWQSAGQEPQFEASD